MLKQKINIQDHTASCKNLGDQGPLLCPDEFVELKVVNLKGKKAVNQQKQGVDLQQANGNRASQSND